MVKHLTAAAVAAAIVCSVQNSSFAQGDFDPKVHWDRIDDVPLGSGFPRFGSFAWRAFIALNWPALTDVADRGKPDQTKKFSDPGPRVWETYKARYEVFAPGAPEPAKWESYKGTNPCGGAITNDKKTLSAFSHFADYNQAAFSLSTLANPLIDQQRVYTRYEVRFNREHFDTIVDDNNKWFIKKNLPTAERPGTFKFGSIEVKAAWRILKAGDTTTKRERFYVTKAFVFDPEATEKQGGTVCNEQDVALVGFHVVIKTKLRPQWIWSSFEHVDNVPRVTDEPDAKSVPAPYSYNSGAPPKALVPVSRPKMISSDNHPNPNPDPMQVVRLFPIQDATIDINNAYRNLPDIKGTIWANYMLVVTQWPEIPGTPSVTNTGTPHPSDGPNLANTTMETYQQTTGCMQCHHGVSNATGKDFVAFMAFDAAEPAQKNIAAAANPVGQPLGDVAIAFKGKAGLMAAKDKAAKKLALSKSQKTALDDDPSVRALVRILQGSPK